MGCEFLHSTQFLSPLPPSLQVIVSEEQRSAVIGVLGQVHISDSTEDDLKAREDVKVCVCVCICVHRYTTCAVSMSWCVWV